MRNSRLEEHNRKMKRLQNKKEIAELKYIEWTMRYDILKTYLPFLDWKVKFQNKAVIISIAVPSIYTVAAFLLHKNMGLEISPTLTTCVFAFFGTELFNASRIKMNEDKYSHDDYIGD